MSISTAILADAPSLYWPLDDPTGPAASDASGNAQPGVYVGTFQLHQPGPEVGTFAALLQDGGLIQSLNTSPRKIRPFSMDCWVGLEMLQTDRNTFLYNGNGNANGMGQLWTAGAAGVGNPIAIILGGNAVGAAVGNVSLGVWHHVGFSSDAAQITNMYIDGVNVYLNQNTGPMNAIGATDKVQIGANKAGQLLYMAHVALYPAVITAARFLAHFQANVTAQSPQPVGGVTSTSQQTIIDQLGSLLGWVARDLRNTP